MYIQFKQNIILTYMHYLCILVLPQPIYNVKFYKHTKHKINIKKFKCLCWPL